MAIGLGSVPLKRKRISTPGLKGMDYAGQIGLCRELEKANARFVDYVLKPATDEMWNLIDGRRTVGAIIEQALLEFDLDTGCDPWVKVFAGWLRSRLIGAGSD